MNGTLCQLQINTRNDDGVTALRNFCNLCSFDNGKRVVLSDNFDYVFHRDPAAFDSLQKTIHVDSTGLVHGFQFFFHRLHLQRGKNQFVNEVTLMGNQRAAVTFGNDYSASTLNFVVTYQIIRFAVECYANRFVNRAWRKTAAVANFDIQNGVGHTKLGSVQCDNSIHLSNLLCSYQLCDVSERVNIGVEEIMVPQPEVCVLNALIRLAGWVFPDHVPSILIIRIALCERLLNGLC
nr:MAG TPA: hypothetical protein [Caudoviricetes sp.]